MKILGKILHALATGLGTIFNVLINILNIITMTFESIRRFLVMVFFIGCSTFIFFPILLIKIPKPAYWFIMAVIFVPILGPKFISFLRYANYTLTEWMYDRADSMITGKQVGHKNISDYSDRYKYEQEQARRRAYEEQVRRQQEEMNRRFEEFIKGFGGYYQQRGPGDFFGGYSNQGGYTGNPYVNDISFKEKYEQSCKTLGVPFDTDVYEVKLAYRKLAKKYHPDINDSTNATEMFTQVNEAYEFLTEENIKKYKAQFM